MKFPKIKIPKKVTAWLLGAAGSATPLIKDVVSQKLKEKEEKREQERIYLNQKHNGMIKYASILFSLVGIFLSILALKQFNLLLAFIGLLSVVVYVITFLYCIEMIQEKQKNTYRILFLIGDMLLVTTATFLFF